jgi:hypothetical protein
MHDGANPLHEKLIQIVRENIEELQSLKQRCTRIERLVKDAPIKFEPTEIAIDVPWQRICDWRDRFFFVFVH